MNPNIADFFSGAFSFASRGRCSAGCSGETKRTP